MGSTEAAREHAIERWHLPHYMKDLEIRFTESGGEMEVNVLDGSDPVLDLVVTQRDYVDTRNLYNAFTVEDGGDGRFKANIYMEAPLSEHEEEQGSLTLYEHAMTDGLTIDDINSYPFREQWYQAGLQAFEPLMTL